MQIIINSAKQLDSLLNKTKKVDFEFEFSELGTLENTHWLKKIKQNYFACGCHTGKIFFIAALLTIIFISFFNHFFVIHTFTFRYYLYAVLFVFLMMGIGKAVGKFIAYKNLKKDISALRFILK